MLASTDEKGRIARVQHDTDCFVRDRLDFVLRDGDQCKRRLPAAAVYEIMSDAMCATAPIARAEDEVHPIGPNLWLSLKRMTTGKEHALSAPVRGLHLWHVHFLDTGMFEGLDVANEALQQLPALSDAVDGFCEETFNFQGEIFRLRAVCGLRKHETDEADTALVYAVTPFLPTTATSFSEAKKAMRGDGRRAMFQLAAVRLAMMSGFVSMAEDETPVEADGEYITGKLNSLSLRFSNEAVFGKRPGMQSFKLKACFDISEPETTAGTVVIPMILRKLRFLRKLVSGPVNYHVKAFSSRSYIMRMLDVGGWDVFVLVNANASLKRLQSWFMSRDAMVGPYAQVAYKPREMDEYMQNLIIKGELGAMQKAYQQVNTELEQTLNVPVRNIGDSERARMTDHEYLLLLQSEGLRLMIEETMREGTKWAGSIKVREGNSTIFALLRHMRPHQAPVNEYIAVTQSDKEMMVRTFFRACLGAADEVWRRAEVAAATHATNVTTIFTDALLNSDELITTGESIERARAEVILRSCTGVSPDRWWERAAAGLGVSSAASICAVLLQNASLWEGLFPTSVLGEIGNWQALVQTATAVCPEMRVGHSHFTAAVSAGDLKAKYARLHGIGLREWDAYRVVMTTAAAYAILTCDGHAVAQFVKNEVRTCFESNADEVLTLSHRSRG